MAFGKLYLPLSAGGAGSVALTTKAIAMVFAKASAVGAAALSVRTIFETKASATFLGKLPLFGMAISQVKITDALTGKVPLLARTKAQVTAFGSVSTSAFVSLVARTIVQVKSNATQALSLALASKIVGFQIKVRTGPALTLANLAGRVAVKFKARASTSTAAQTATRVWAYLFSD